MKKLFVLVIAVFGLVFANCVPPAPAAPPGSCRPWPSCKNTTTTTTRPPVTTTTTRPPVTTTTVAPTTTTKPPVTTTTAPPTTTTSTTTTTRPPVTGAFTVASGRIMQGSTPFVAVGANVGTTSNFDWHGVADGQSSSAQSTWKWNTIRLNVVFQPLYATTADTMAHVQGIINEYTAKGIVVMVASHDTTAAPNTMLPVAVQSFATLAANNKANARVWFNCVNEPDTGTTTAWVQLQQQCLSTIRNQGNSNIVVADAIEDGEDASWDPDYLKNYAGRVGGTNVVFAIHNYGSYTTVASYTAHLDELRNLGFAVLTGETGYTTSESATTGHGPGAVASLGTYANGYGVLAWHGTHGDGYYLRANGDPFYINSALSDFGSRLYALTH